jgi:hypothetical protein
MFNAHLHFYQITIKIDQVSISSLSNPTSNKQLTDTSKKPMNINIHYHKSIIGTTIQNLRPFSYLYMYKKIIQAFTHKVSYLKIKNQ